MSYILYYYIRNLNKIYQALYYFTISTGNSLNEILEILFTFIKHIVAHEMK